MVECKNNLIGWSVCQYEDLLSYEQPTKYIVESTEYSDRYKIPVLTAGKSFIKGYTNETNGIFENLPVIIFDDFTTASKFVSFPFKVKSSAMKILVPSCELVNIKFAFYRMQVDIIRNDTHKRYWISVYAKKEVYLPPLAEQKRIVAKIEELFSELDKGIESLKKARDQLKVYRQAVLKHAFEGRLTEKWRKENKGKLETVDQLLASVQKERETRYQHKLDKWNKDTKEWEANEKKKQKPAKPKKPSLFSIPSKLKLTALPYGWAWMSFGNSGDWMGGGTPSKSCSEYWEKGNILWVSPKDMKYRNVTDTLQKITEISIANSSAKLIKRQSILFVVRSGILRRVLPVAIAPADITVNQDMQAVSPYSHSIEFLYWYSVANDYQIRHQCSKDGTTVESIDVGKLKEFPCPVTSIEEQNEIVRQIEKVMSIIDEIESDITVNLRRSESLRQSILKKAFSGKLVEQDSSDEPARVLLEHIKAEKEKYLRSAPKNKISKKKTKKRKVAA